jgi:hypothetical protein
LSPEGSIIVFLICSENIEKIKINIKKYQKILKNIEKY